MEFMSPLHEPNELIDELLSSAGVRGVPESIVALGESTNRVWKLTVDSDRFVVKQRLDASADLARKESYLSELLGKHDVPAPRVLSVAIGAEIGILTSFADGMRLDEAIESVPADQLASAWRSVGEAMRRAHSIELPVAGEIVGDRIEPFPGGWASWATEDLSDLLFWLANRFEVSVERQLVDRFVIVAREVLAEAPVRLIHNDALPQNFMVARQSDGDWRCTGLLDWEFARAGDPRWDIATLDLRSAGLVPDAFYEGYGSRPSEPEATIYEVLTAAWKTRAQLEGHGDWHWSPLVARCDYFRRLPDLLSIR